MKENWMNDGHLHFGVGIENTFVPQEKVGHRSLDEYELTQHYERWREDLDLVAESGATFLRWGIPWYLVEPRPGTFDWRWLDEVAEYMGSLGLRCIVDLVHYGTPLWLDNQFLNSDYPERVAAYGRAIAERYAGVWDDFTPLNEPVINAIWCGEMGMWPPYLSGQDGFTKLVVALARGIVRTQKEIAAANPAATFVHVDAGFRWDGDSAEPSRQFLEERRFLGLDLVLGRVTDTHPLRGFLREHGVTNEELLWFEANNVTPDLIGVNYYPAFTTSLIDAGGKTSPVEAGRVGLRDLLETYWERYSIPLAVTETSRGGSVESRVAWLHDSVSEVRAIRDDRIPVVAYAWFPFFTLVDWLYREDVKAVDDWFVHMGLVDLERGADRGLRRLRTDVFDQFQRTSAASEDPRLRIEMSDFADPR